MSSHGRFTATFATGAMFALGAVALVLVVEQEQVLLLQVQRLVDESSRRWLLALALLQQPLAQLPPRGHRATAPHPQGRGDAHHQRHEDPQHEDLHRWPTHSMALVFNQPRIATQVLVPVTNTMC